MTIRFADSCLTIPGYEQGDCPTCERELGYRPVPVARRAFALLNDLGSVNCADTGYIVRGYGQDALDYCESFGWIEPSEHNCSDWFTYETTERGTRRMWKISDRVGIRPFRLATVLLGNG